jgi:hypothetical protein
MSSVTSDNFVSIDVATVKSVTTDQVKKVIKVSVEIPLNGDNFTAANKVAFWAFNENEIKMDLTPYQQSFG